MCCANRIRRLRVLLKILMLKTGTGESLPFFAALLAIYTRSACYTVSFAAAGINAASCASNMVCRQISLDETRALTGFCIFYRYVKPDIYTLCNLPSRQKLRVFLNLHHCAALWCVSPLNS